MTEKRICAECKFHERVGGIDFPDMHRCSAHVIDTQNFVTGQIIREGFLDCMSINQDGNCPDFRPKDGVDE